MPRSILWLALVLALVGQRLAAADISQTLAIQEAMRSARDSIIKGNHGRAVELLEKQLDHVQGDPGFLSLLREAYVGHLKDLQLAGKSETVAVYRERLKILERATPPKAAIPVAPMLEPTPSPPRTSVARGARPDDDPFIQVPVADRKEAEELLTRADQAFASKQFDEANQLFARANVSRPTLTDTQRSQWAYCIINAAVTKFNAPNPPPAETLDNEIRAALTMAPKGSAIERFGREVLEKVSGAGNSGIPMTGAPIRHLDGGDGWRLAECANFRLHHNQPREAAEQILRQAEQHRAAAFAKWAATNPPSWLPICDIYMYANGADYAKATKQDATAPGHSTIKAHSGKVVARRMDLRADDPNFLGSVLPHEITHVVLGDLFADAPLPRWADEGMAVLSEPRSQIERYGKTLMRCWKQGQLLPLGTLLNRSDYPDAASVTVFYVESVSVVEYLVNQKGPAAFVNFMHDSNRGLDAALAKHYGIRNASDLQDRWLRATFTEEYQLIKH